MLNQKTKGNTMTKADRFKIVTGTIILLSVMLTTTIITSSVCAYKTQKLLVDNKYKLVFEVKPGHASLIKWVPGR